MTAKQPEIEELRAALRAALNAYQRDGRTGTLQSENVIDAAVAVVRAYDEQVARADRMRDEAVKAALLQETADPGVYSGHVPGCLACGIIGGHTRDCSAG